MYIVTRLNKIVSTFDHTSKGRTNGGRERESSYECLEYTNASSSIGIPINFLSASTLLSRMVSSFALIDCMIMQ